MTVKYSNSLTTLFGFANSSNSGYFEAAATFDLGNGFSLAPHAGYQSVAGNSSYSYTDFSLTGAKDFGNGWVVTLAAIGTDTKSIGGVKAYASPVNGKDMGAATAVLGVKKTF